MPRVEYIILTGWLMGSLARLYLLKIDFRQYPSYPQGYVIHLTLGAIAAGLGAVVIPAVLKQEYAAVTFLALAIQQFREVRRMERDSLESVEKNELVQRGSAYIEDISKKFEARNYVALVTSIITTAAIYLLKNAIAGVIAGLVTIFLLRLLVKSKRIGDIAEVLEAKIHFDGPLLMVDDIVIMNVAIDSIKKNILEKGKAARIIPRGMEARATLSNLGQRQAILHDIVSILGVRREMDEPEHMPLARRNTQNGEIAIFILTMESSIDGILAVIKRAPVLETSRRQPLDSSTGRKFLE